MTKEELELKRLIYGQSNTIVLKNFNNYFEALKEIELVRSTMTINGFIFKPDFADSKKLKEFNEEDWSAMFAQYSITYGWSEKYESYTGKDAYTVLQEYVNKEPENEIKVEISENNFSVESEEFYNVVLQDIANSKTVLREHQIRIINLMPIVLIENVFKNTNFTIKETEILFIKRLISSGSNEFKFKDADQIVRFVVSSFRSNGEPILGKLNKTILKDVEVKLPTSFKKKLLLDINEISIGKALGEMHKYKQFWKRLFKQLAWTSKDKLEKRYPKAMIIKEALFNNEYIKPNGEIEAYKAEGNYEKALTLEMKNPGQMLRNLMQYLRYEKKDIVVKKIKPKKTIIMANLIESTNENIVIKKDATSVIESEEFYNTLLKANTKLLWQVLGLLDEKSSMLKPVREKKMNNTKIRYKKEIAVKENLAKTVRKKIKNAIKQKKRKENSNIGSVYLDQDIENYIIQYSGREDTSISLSGEYLPSGSRIDLNQIIPDKDLDKSLLRIGLAWKGIQSCDIDLSMNIKNYGAVYYGKNSMKIGDDLIITSSGDITSCSNNIFSTELIDVDLKKFKKHGFTEMFNSAIMYYGSTFKNTECYWFMSVIKKKDRVIPGRKMIIDFNDMHYATQITDESKGMIGLNFNIKEGYAEVLNIPMKHVKNGMNSKESEYCMKKAISEMPVRQNYKNAISMSINKQQLVDDIKFADVIISNKEPDVENYEEKVVWLHPGRDAVKLQEMLF